MTAHVHEIIDCVDCGRPTRPTSAKLADYPGTLTRGGQGRCLTCYKATRPPEIRTARDSGPRIVQMPRELVFANVPAAREPQKSDCRASCCKTPFICAKRYHCRCHGEGS